MNPVGELLALEDIRLDLDVSTKAQLLEQIAALLAARHGLLRDVHSGEPDGARATGLDGCGSWRRDSARAHESVCRSRRRVRANESAIPFDAPDGKPVSVFLGLIVPNQANERHLQLLATAAGMLNDRNFRDSSRQKALRGL